MAVRNVDIFIRAHDQTQAGFAGASAGAMRMSGGLMMLKGAAIAAAAMIAMRLVGAIKESIAAFGEWEDQLAKVSTMLVGKSMKHLGEYSEAIKKFSVQYGQSTEKLSNSAYDILSAQIDVTKGVKLLEVTTRMAVGGFTDVAVATEAMTNILNSYSLSVEHATAVSDLLQQAVFLGKTTFEQVAQGIGAVASTANRAGARLDELLAAVAAVTQKGEQAEIVWRTLRMVFLKFISPSQQASDIAKEYGIELGSATIRSMGLYGALKQFEKLPTDLLGKVFPKASSDVLGKLLLNLPKMKTNLDELAGASGAAGDAFDKASGTFGFKLKQMQQSFAELQRSIGEAFEPLVEMFGEWFEQNKDEILQFFKTLASAFRLLGKILLPILSAALTLLKPILWILEKVMDGIDWFLGKMFGEGAMSGAGAGKGAKDKEAVKVKRLLDEMARQQKESEAKEIAKMEAQKEREQIAAQNKMQETVDAVTEKLRTQIATFGMTNDQIEIYKLRLKGATSAQIRMVEVLQAQAAEQNKQAEKNKQAEQAHRKSLQEVLAAREMLSRAAPAVQSRFMTDAPNRILNVQVRHQVEANQMAARRERLLTRVVDELRRIRMDGGGLELQRADL